MRKIDFAEDAPQYWSAQPGLQCAASVDGALCTYAVTAEALEEHFAAGSYRKEDLVSAFADHRVEIERVARTFFEMTGARNIVLHSGHFRFAA
ncbi:DUF1488 domain-containing protein [Cupriavidus gilardii]|jgi:hypothetical protein|uniref:DUF1488 domain-containing protein n=1 Tax=Cupriavidus gilardii TaxID=82541 RepID=A0ABY4VQP0_9BURK|nr:DUF1488 domain-containing protein [Cupriavidus gilardii]MCT9074807.1 DUF1488 domain-containing protein [Cupriavidus gilardii]QKS63609.1 DUF1488 domain-containing protein [Cupriavidus gilardii]USE78612.1 DUF1488 domain-containing protein [Cupriavidus gilardii]